MQESRGHPQHPHQPSIPQAPSPTGRGDLAVSGSQMSACCWEGTAVSWPAVTQQTPPECFTLAQPRSSPRPAAGNGSHPKDILSPRCCHPPPGWGWDEPCHQP